MKTLNPNNHTLHEALTEVGAVQTREEKVQLLHKWNSYALQMVLRGAYDDKIEFNFCKTRQYPYDEMVWKLLKFISTKKS